MNPKARRTQERELERRVARRQVLGVRQHRLDQLLGVALLAQDRRAVLRMLVERGVDLVVEVVQQRRRAPELLVLPELLRVGADRRLDGERVRLRASLCVYSVSVCQARSRVTSTGELSSPPLMTHMLAETLAESFVIEGGRPLNGRVRAAGNKNGALPILAATLLASEPVTLTNVPRIRDVETMVELLDNLGAKSVDRPNEVTVDGTQATKTDVDPVSRPGSAHRSSSPGH